MNPWTDTLIEHLTARWRDGISASEIAKEINAAHRVTFTRNAVIGKLHRLGLCGTQAGKASAPRRLQYSRKRVLITPAAPPAPPAPASPPPAPPAPPALNIAFRDLRRNHCRAIVSGVKADALYCGHAIVEGRSYCAHHHARYTTGEVWAAGRGLLRYFAERTR